MAPDIYDPQLNPPYRDVLAHYGVTALPCRVRDPDRKGKVESGVAHAQKTPLKGKCFESLEEAQAYLDHWEERWADTRIHGRTKRQVAAMSGPAGMQGPPAVRHSCAADNPDPRNARSPERALRPRAFSLKLRTEGGFTEEAEQVLSKELERRHLTSGDGVAYSSLTFIRLLSATASAPEGSPAEGWGTVAGLA